MWMPLGKGQGRSQERYSSIIILTVRTMEGPGAHTLALSPTALPVFLGGSAPPDTHSYCHSQLHPPIYPDFCPLCSSSASSSMWGRTPISPLLCPPNWAPGNVISSLGPGLGGGVGAGGVWGG